MDPFQLSPNRWRKSSSSLREEESGQEEMWLMVRDRLTDEDAVERLWEQISDNLAVLRRQNTGWDPLERGFMDLTEDLVVALTDSSGGRLHWLGQGRGGKDMMHFDWRSGTIRHGHRI